jgi:HAD superfamily hydrolase (TIGR01509 family)
LAIQAIIFDFDGTMVDTESAAFDSWVEIYTEFGVELPLEEWQKCVGASAKEFDPVLFLNQLTGKSFDYEQLMGRKNAQKLELSNQLPLLPGVLNCIEQAKLLGLKMAVASSSSYEWVDHHLRRTHVRDHFPHVVTKGDVTNVKPDPEIFLTTSSRLGIDPRFCLVVEDSNNGVLAAKSAGMQCVAVPGPITANLDFSHADKQLSSLLEIDLSMF